MENVFSAKLYEKKLIAKETYEVSFKLARPISFIPGQYIWASISESLAKDGRGNRRAFTICKVNNEKNIISVVLRRSTSDYKKYLLALPISSAIIVVGPFGSFYLPEKLLKPLVFVAGGTGMGVIDKSGNGRFDSKVSLGLK